MASAWLKSVWHCHQECELCERNVHRLLRWQKLGDKAGLLCGVTDRSGGAWKEGFTSHTAFVSLEMSLLQLITLSPQTCSSPQSLIILSWYQEDILDAGARSTTLFEYMSEPPETPAHALCLSRVCTCPSGFILAYFLSFLCLWLLPFPSWTPTQRLEHGSLFSL